MADERRNTEIFVVRLWHERDASNAPLWRGSVEHVSTRSIRYFVDFRGLRAALNERTDPGLPDVATGEEEPPGPSDTAHPD